MSEPECCICLSGFSSPASLPCGHRFCLGCIGEYWRIHGACLCPLCMTVFPTRPQLTAAPTAHAEEHPAAPLKAGEVPCDLCPDRRAAAVKSCLRCMASYCAAHLEPHYRAAELGRHLLIDVSKNLEEPVCGLHGKPLNRFCRSDRSCICGLCARSEHRGHHIVSVGKQAAHTKVKLKQRRTKLQQDIQERQSRVEKIKLSAVVGEEAPREAWAQDKELLGRLEGEIRELQRRNTELETLSHTEDNLCLLQRFLHTASSSPVDQHLHDLPWRATEQSL